MTSNETEIEARAKAAVARRVRAVLRLISPEHITPIGVRQIELALEEESPTAAAVGRGDSKSEVTEGVGSEPGAEASITSECPRE